MFAVGFNVVLHTQVELGSIFMVPLLVILPAQVSVCVAANEGLATNIPPEFMVRVPFTVRVLAVVLLPIYNIPVTVRFLQVAAAFIFTVLPLDMVTLSEDVGTVPVLQVAVEFQLPLAFDVIVALYPFNDNNTRTPRKIFLTLNRFSCKGQTQLHKIK